MSKRMTRCLLIALAGCLLAMTAFAEADDIMTDSYGEIPVGPAHDLDAPGLTIEYDEDEPLTENDGEIMAPLFEAWDETVAFELSDELSPALLPPEAETQSESFSGGYATVAAGTTVYADEAMSQVMGTFTQEAIVYAQAWGSLALIHFEAGRARSTGNSLKAGFAPWEAVSVMTEYATQRYRSAWTDEFYNLIQLDGWPIPNVGTKYTAHLTGNEPMLQLSLGGTYHTPQEIQAFADALPASVYQIILYEAVPTAERPWYHGTLSGLNLRSALNMVNRFRYIAGLNADVALDAEGVASAQAKAYLNYLNDSMDHSPKKPEALTDEEYNSLNQLANSGWWSECLHSSPMLTGAIPGWVSDRNNVVANSIGHRTAVLAPGCTKMAFGSAGVASLHITEYNGPYVRNVAWPARETPVEYFSTYDMWSVFACEDAHAAESTTVQLVRRSDGQTWSFSSGASNGYFAVNSSQILFRPEGLKHIDAGETFDVTITDSANMEQLIYSVHFFSLDTGMKELPEIEARAWISADGVQLTWDAVPGAQGYYVCIESGDFLRIVADVYDPSYFDASVQSALDHAYTVIAHTDTLTGPFGSNVEYLYIYDNGIYGKVKDDTITFLQPLNSAAEVKIPDTVSLYGSQYRVTAIAEAAFSGDQQLVRVTLGKHVQTIGDGAFENCVRLKQVKTGADLAYIGERAFFGCKRLTSINLGRKVAIVGESAFEKCVKLKTVKGGSGLERIDARAFFGCKRLTSIDLGKKAFYIDNSAFEKCVKLKTVKGGPGLEVIGTRAFFGCSKLAAFTLGSKVVEVSDKAFMNCKSLKKVTIKSRVLYRLSIYDGGIQANAFKGVPAKIVFICPSGLARKYAKVLKAAGAPGTATYK